MTKSTHYHFETLDKIADARALVTDIGRRIVMPNTATSAIIKLNEMEARVKSELAEAAIRERCGAV